jgi:hypothetical protein
MPLLSGICDEGRLLAFAEPANEQSTSQLLERIRDDLHPGQRAFFDDDTTQILGLSAGYGAGKTRSLCAKALALAAANQGFIG